MMDGWVPDSEPPVAGELGVESGSLIVAFDVRAEGGKWEFGGSADNCLLV